MRNFIINLGYFFKELKRIIKGNLLSNFFTFIGTILILFLLSSVVTGWSIASRLVRMLEEESEISVFFNKDMEEKDVESLAESLRVLDGVMNARIVYEAEAYDRMKEILGNDASVLELFDKNPFKGYIEIGIKPNQINSIVNKVEDIEQIEYVRDNREVLEQINGIIEGMNVISYLIMAAVGITTVIIISHMIRQGIYNNRDQIRTLHLLGASRLFIGFPFICVGLVITTGAGILASLIMAIVIHNGYKFMGGAIPFIPLPPEGSLVLGVVVVLMGVSIILGILGSIFGLSSIKDN